MLYAIIWEDVENSLPLRMEARPAHLERIRTLVDAGRVVTAGPFPAVEAEAPGEAGFTGSLIVAEFASLADAEAWISEDPYTTRGIIKSVTVKPFVQVVP